MCTDHSTQTVPQFQAIADKDTPLTRNFLDVLALRVDVDEASGCWRWTGNAAGASGMVRFGGKLSEVRDVIRETCVGIDEAYEQCCTFGGIKAACCNPSHLKRPPAKPSPYATNRFHGNGTTHKTTPQEDKKKPRRSRDNAGDWPTATMTRDEVQIARALHKKGYTASVVAKVFGKAYYVMRDCLRRQTWASLPDRELTHEEFCTYTAKAREFVTTPKYRPRRGESHGRAVLDESKVSLIRALYDEGGLRSGELSDLFGVCPTTIDMVVKRRTWRHVADRCLTDEEYATYEIE